MRSRSKTPKFPKADLYAIQIGGEEKSYNKIVHITLARETQEWIKRSSDKNSCTQPSLLGLWFGLLLPLTSSISKMQIACSEKVVSQSGFKRKKTNEKKWTLIFQRFLTFVLNTAEKVTL